MKRGAKHTVLLSFLLLWVGVFEIHAQAVDTSATAIDTSASATDTTQVAPPAPTSDFEIRFAEKDLIAYKGELIANNLTLVNNTSNSASLSIVISVPEGWRQFGGKGVYDLAPGGTKLVPVRLLPTHLQGNTKFVINVQLYDGQNNQVGGSFFYVGSHKVVDWDLAVNPANTMYFKNGQKNLVFDVSVINMGNFQQDLVMSLKGVRADLILKDEEGKIIDNPKASLQLNSLEDTSFSYQIETKKEDRNFRAISIQQHRPNYEKEEQTYSLFVNTAEATKSGKNLIQRGQRLNFVRLGNGKKVNEYSGPVLPLVLDANVQNVLNNNTFMNLILRGFQTFNDGSNLVYFNQFIYGTNYFSQNFLQRGSYYAGYFHKRFTVEAGNIAGGNFGLPAAGVGVKGRVRAGKSHWFTGYYLGRGQNFQSQNITNFGGQYQYLGTGVLRGMLGVAQNIDNNRGRQATVASSRIGVRITKSHNVTFTGAYSTRSSTDPAIDTLDRQGFLLGLNYSGRYLNKKLTTNLSGRLQQRTFGLADNERRIVNSRIQYFINSKSLLYYYGTLNENRFPSSVIGGPVQEVYNMIYYNTLGYTRNTRFGTVQNYAFYNVQSVIGKRTIYPGLGLRYSNFIFDRNILWATNVQAGYENALFLPDLPWYFKLNANILFRYRTLSLVSAYFYGPNSPASIESMVANNVNPVFLRTSLTYQYLFKNTHWVLQSNFNHTYQKTLNSNRIGAFPELFYYTNDGWRFSLGVNYTISTRKLDNATVFNEFGIIPNEERLTSQSNQVNVSIRKEFGIPIPFLKKNNFTQKFYAFYDLDGDGQKSGTEPGLENVVIRLGQHSVLTNYDGVADMIYVPAGMYAYSAFSLEELNGWFPNIEDSLMIYEEGAQYVPFVKGVKIYGKVVVDREKVRTDKDKDLDLSNIKITAFNDEKVVNTLTDFEGNFEFYLPNGKYTLSMDENVLGTKYTLVQNNYSMELVSGVEGLYFTFNIVERKRKVVSKKFGSSGNQIRRSGTGAAKKDIPKISRPKSETERQSDSDDQSNRFNPDPNGMPIRIPSPETDDQQITDIPPRRVSMEPFTENIGPLLNAPVIDVSQLKFIVDLGTFTETVPTDLVNMFLNLGYSNHVSGNKDSLRFLSTRFTTIEEAEAIRQRAIDANLIDPAPQVIGEYQGRRLTSEQTYQLYQKALLQDPNEKPASPIQW